ncbi:cellulose biosynthesis protein BcsQ [Budvicia diplopodorum]|uniref:cellulose biosynthesis protein BcsQ n=1 Tax=Budvicia diplopodorum TaxID=1119056 RepID=UPI00135C9CD0|nr:cellulose biosynthesis protein BcsQ [Budvicia diplopodorum]
MTTIAIQGIRGGCGATSVTASLSWSLANLGQSVLVIDFSPANLLRLYFDMPYSDKRGWIINNIQSDSHNGVINYSERLDYLPLGLLDEKMLSMRVSQLLSQMSERTSKYPQQLEGLFFEQYQWILIDASGLYSPLVKLAQSLADIHLCVLNPDVACDVLLQQQELPNNSYFLLNRFSPTSLIQQDINHIWQRKVTNLIPIVLHADEALPESFAAKKPVGLYQPESLIAQEFNTLAQWCASFEHQGTH